MLKYALKKRFRKKAAIRITAVQVLQDTMELSYSRSVKVYSNLIDIVNEYHETNKVDQRVILQLSKDLLALRNLAVDCAHKLAPYQTPKLETLEVKSKVEHRYVMRAPQSMSWDEWAKHTKSEEIKIGDVKDQMDKAKRGIVSTPAPSIHDFDQDEQDFYNLNNPNNNIDREKLN